MRGSLHGIHSVACRAFFGAVGAALLSTALLAAGTAHAQATGDVFGTQDTLFMKPSRAPITYITTYDRDVSSGTWTQLVSYGFARRRVAFSTDANYTTIDLARSNGLGLQNGALTGQLSYRATKQLVLSLGGTFDRAASRDLVSGTSQRRNRLKLTSQYSVRPWRVMSVQGVLSSEFQQDHGLTRRPIGQAQLRILTNAAGDSDSVYVYDQRDSTFMSGRQDGLSVQTDWRPKNWLQVTANANGTRVRQHTNSYLQDFARAADGSPVQIAPDHTPFESPNATNSYESKVTYTGIRGLLAWVNVKDLHNDQGYFEKSLRNLEHLLLDQRSGLAHLEYSPIRGGQLSVYGKMERVFSQYGLRANRTSLVHGRSLQTSFNYAAPSQKVRASVALDLDHKENTRQQSGNGLTTSHFLLMNGGFRVSPRLGLDASGTVSLLSSKYVTPVLDQDNQRTYVNVGGIYVVSARCSTTVHFSAGRGHVIAIDPSRSGNNNVQSTYQMDASLRLGVSRTIGIVQTYLLNALYQIYDQPQADSRSVLSRIKRIDTMVADSLFPFATVQLVHNFLFRDSGSYRMAIGGGGREYNVGSETYQQTLGATLNVKPTAGVQVFLTQSLGNTTVKFPGTDIRTVSNRWNLAVGATVDRAVMGGASLHGTVQHVGAYTERQNPGDPLNEQDDWIAGVTFQKEF